jgi:hypothetical protein
VNGGKTDDDSGRDNNSIQFFIIYVLSQQPQGQLQTQHSTDIHNYIMDTNNINNNNNNLLQYCHMKNFTYNSSSHILLRASVILYLY